MANIDSHQARTKTVLAPPPSAAWIVPSIFSIEIQVEEEVQWQWLELPDGNRVVVDYQIISKGDRT